MEATFRLSSIAVRSLPRRTAEFRFVFRFVCRVVPSPIMQIVVLVVTGRQRPAEAGGSGGACEGEWCGGDV